MLTDFFFFNEFKSCAPWFPETVQSQLIGVDIFEKGFAVFVYNMQMMLKLVEGDQHKDFRLKFYYHCNIVS